MKTVLTILLTILVTIPAFSNDRRSWNVNPVMENNQQERPSVIVYANNVLRENYPGAIPNADNFWDYQTNGANLQAIWANGDTIIITYPAVDSTDPTGATTRLNFYTMSTDGGATWIFPLNVTSLPNRSAYPDLAAVIDQGQRNIVIMGRKYVGANSRGGAWIEASLGLGSFSGENAPFQGRDFFGRYQGGTLVAGVYSNPDAQGTPQDSLLYARYDFSNNTFGTRTPIAVPGPDSIISVNVRYRHAVSTNGQTQFVMWWNPLVAGQEMNSKVSTDGGNTWGPRVNMQKAFGNNGVINGDTCSPWFGIDAAFKPGTQEYAAVWSTLYPTATGQSSGDPQGTKILYWNPLVNSGNPVEVAGNLNMPIISVDSLFVNRNALQVGVTPVSHPSVAFSQDGNMIVCVFSAFQPGDTSNVTPSFTFNDIYSTYSTNNGLTWSTPRNLTQTPDWDELYPVLSESGNSSSKFHLKFQSTRIPGSQSFTDNAPTARVYTVYRSFNPTTGIEVNNVGSVVPDKFDLKQNYPNPFNPSTKIRFDLAKNSNVTLKVYNVLGKEVATLLNNQLVTAGTKEVTFDGEGLASGIYFYTLSTESFSTTKKMILQK